MERKTDFTGIKIKVVMQAYNEGMRADQLTTPQPAPWFKRGLEILENGGELTPQAIEQAERAGGTDHLDPYF